MLKCLVILDLADKKVALYGFPLILEETSYGKLEARVKSKFFHLLLLLFHFYVLISLCIKSSLYMQETTTMHHKDNIDS